MDLLIILNIVLIIFILFLVFYIFRNKKNNTNNICVNERILEIEKNEHKQNDNLNSGRVFIGRFVSDEEYQRMMKNRRSDISILLEEVNNEYEHLKELSK